MEKTIQIGSFLKQKRETEKLSINDVASKTKINLNILKHLENNALDQLPNKAYVIGFVKSYCKLLSLNTNEVLDLLEKAYTPEEVEKKSNTVTTTQPTSQSDEDERHEIKDKIFSIAQSIFKKKIMMPIAILAIVAIILKGIVSFFVQLANEEKEYATNTKEEKVIVVSEEIKQNIEIKEKDPTIKKVDDNLFESEAHKKLVEENLKEEQKRKATIDATKAANAKELADKKVREEKKNQEVAKNKMAKLNGKFPYKKFYPAPRKMYQALNDAAENKNEQLLPKRFKNAIENDKQNVYIQATNGDTWISYQSDDNEIKRFVLKKGRSVLIKGKIILLFMGNINVAHIFYNNKLIQTHSKTGVKSLIFPQLEATNYELPLFPAFNGVPHKASEYKANMASE